MEPIKIRWETGHMEINPDVFFPTSTARIRKLLRVVALDFPHQDDLRMQMARYCEDRAEEILSDRKRLANEAVNYHQKVADLQPPIDTAKRRITALRACIQEEQEALKKLKTQQSIALAAFKKKQKEFEVAEGVAKKLKQNAEVLRS